MIDKIGRLPFIYFKEGFRIFGRCIINSSSPIFAQKVFRSFRVFQLHSRLWSEYISNLAIKNGHTNPKSKKWLISFILYSLCDPKFKNIKDEEIFVHAKDLDFIRELTEATVVCPDCGERLVIDKKVSNIKYCHCLNSPSAYNRKIDGYDWSPFVETPDLIVWRQPKADRPGLYMYKVYGNYDDITSREFFSTQMDIVYRKKWDSSVITLDIIDEDKSTNSELIYWEMKWPRLFANRDYCFTRRHKIDEKEKEMVIMNMAVDDPKVPEKKGNVRVKEYYSVMHIRALKGMDEKGLEFGLTYFDNPGLSLPTWLSNWAAMSGIPNFLTDVRKAAIAKRGK